MCDEDTEKDLTWLSDKITGLRIFEDENEKMNLSVLDIDGEALVISQFTLCADCRSGNRPSFSSSAKPDEADRLYNVFMDELKKCGVKNVQHGIFAADMRVEIVNDGPVTIMMDTDIYKQSRRAK